MYRLDYRKICIPLALACGICPVCSASTFSALNIDFLGRCGGSHGLVADAGNLDNALWNPSGLGFFTGEAAFAGFMDYMVGVRGGTAGYVAGAGNMGYGAYLSYLSSGALTRTSWGDPAGGEGQTFDHSELTVGVSQGLQLLPNLAVGTGLKVARQNLDEASASGLLLDATTTLRLYPWGGGRLSGPAVFTSFVVRNLALARWQDDEGEVPRNSEMGLALRWPDGRVSYGLSFHFGQDGRRQIRTGLSARLSDEFEARVGYRRRTGVFSDSGSDLPLERGLLAGFGIGFGRLWIDYAFEDASPLDGIHRFALRVVLR
jgi:hypothetical protein